MFRIQRLEKELKNAQHPAEKIDALQNLLMEVFNCDHQRALSLHQEIQTLSEAHQIEKGLIYTQMNTGVFHYYEPNTEQAEKYLLSAAERFREIGEQSGEAWARFYLGLLYWSFGDLEKGFEFTTRTLELGEAGRDYLIKAWALNMLGGYYYDLGNYPQSLEYFRKALTIFRNEDAREGMTRSLNGVGNNYHAMGELQKALAYQNKSLKIQKTYHNRQVKSRVLNDIAGVYFTMQDCQSTNMYSVCNLIILVCY